MTPLGAALSLQETQATAIAVIVEASMKAGSVAGGAGKLGVGLRTMRRWISEYTELRRALVAALPDGRWNL